MITGRVDFEELEHTADAGIVVRAEDFARLCERMASAMCALMYDTASVALDERREVRVDALDRETLLVAWLSEVLGLSMSEGLALGGFEARLVEPWVLEGVVVGEALDERRHHFETEIKAVTYHHLEVRELDEGEGGGLVGRVLFDL